MGNYAPTRKLSFQGDVEDRRRKTCEGQCHRHDRVVHEVFTSFLKFHPKTTEDKATPGVINQRLLERVARDFRQGSHLSDRSTHIHTNETGGGPRLDRPSRD